LLFRLFQQRRLEPGEEGVQVRSAVAQVEAGVGRHLVVAAAGGVELAGEGADAVP
jgi:hypothetical protein